MVHESTNLHLPISPDLIEVESPYLQYHCALVTMKGDYDLVPSIRAVNSRGILLIEMYPPPLSLVSCQAISPSFCGRLRMSVDSPLRADSGPGTKRQNRYRHQAKKKSLFVAYSDSLGFTLGFTVVSQKVASSIQLVNPSVKPSESEYATT